MAIILLLKTLLTHLFGIIYVGAITWLFPLIIVVAILLMFGINASKLFTAGAKTIGQSVCQQIISWKYIGMQGSLVL